MSGKKKTPKGTKQGSGDFYNKGQSKGCSSAKTEGDCYKPRTAALKECG